MVLDEAEFMVADGRSRRVGRVVLLAMVGVLALTMSACSSADKSSPTTPGVAGATSSGSKPVNSSAAPSPTAKVPSIKLISAKTKISYLKPVKISVADGSLTSMRVSGKASGAELTGSVSGDGTSWESETPPKPASSYQAVAQIKDSSGQIRTKSVTFKVAAVPESQKVSFNVTPAAGSTVGIAEPIDVHFYSAITSRAAIEKAMEVTATTPGGSSVTGSWHWLNSQDVHWRPKSFWTPGTKVSLHMGIAGVKAGANRYGRKDYNESFTIGASHVTRVDASTHRVRVYRDGKLIDNWATGTGRHGLQTYSGTYVVLGKAKVVQMDSCSARITCDKKAADYYNEKEYWATRITASGTFLHAASWDPLLGRANTSHGCIHLSDANAENFYNHAVPGDVVIVSHTGRGPQERINTQDPGLYDWNLSWSAWTAGSAVK
jgi:lipoprotein-anchoring transpeptidase ErfK/SrfK